MDAVASAAERPNATAIETAHLVEGTASTSATASISSTHSEAAATSTAPPLRLRPLTLDDFLRPGMWCGRQEGVSQASITTSI